MSEENTTENLTPGVVTASQTGTGDTTNPEATGEDKRPPEAEGDQPTPEETAANEQTGETQGEDGESDGADEESSGEEAPDQYEQFTLPEGMEVDEKRMESFQEFAKANGMSQEAAQKTLDYMADEMPKLMQEVSQAQMDAYMQQQLGWKQSYEKDPEIGGDKRTETEAAATRALRAFGNESLVELLDIYDAEKNPNGLGLGNHPEVMRFLAKAGAVLSEDGHVAGDGNQGGGESNVEDRWYKFPDKS